VGSSELEIVEGVAHDAGGESDNATDLEPSGSAVPRSLAIAGERRVRIAGPIQRLAATDAARART
jgi:hypothetical protein